MRTYLFIILFQIMGLWSFGQNLVPNYSFEETHHLLCFYSQSTLDFDTSMVNWFCTSECTCDFWSKLNPISCAMHPPANTYASSYKPGYQDTRTGNNMAGAVLYQHNGIVREYVATQLTEPILPNTGPYLVRFYANIANKASYAVHVSALFTKHTSFVNIWWNLPFTPQLTSEQPVSDTASWTELSWYYYPEDTMNYITIGNFETDETIYKQIVNPINSNNPPYRSYYFYDDVTVKRLGVWISGDTTICQGDTATLFANGSQNDNVHWALSSNTSDFISSDSLIRVVPLVDTQYWLYGPEDTVHFTVHVNNTTLNLGNDTTICLGDTLNLNASIAGFNNLWSDLSSGTDFYVNQAGTYALQISKQSCVLNDTIVVDVNPGPSFSLGNDMDFCSGQSITIGTSIPNATYVWNTGQTESFINVNQAGTYWVDITVDHCTNRDSMYLVELSEPLVDIGPQDTILCPGQTLLLDATYLNSSYYWELQLSSDSVMWVQEEGKYIVEVTNPCGSATDFINVYYSDIYVDLGSDTSLFPNQSLILNAGNSSAYQWSNGSAQQSIQINAADLGIGTFLYSVTVTDDNQCHASDTIQIEVIQNTLLTNIDAEQDLKVYPNPSNGTFNVNVNEQMGSFRWEVWNPSGKKINEGATRQSNFTIVINQSGVFYLKVFFASQVRIVKLMVE